MNQAQSYVVKIMGLLYPPLCITCGKRLHSQENYLCQECRADMPEGRFHNDPENKIARIFWGRVPIEYATSLFEYRKGSRYQKIIYFTKYRGMKKLGFEAGKWLGEILSASEHFMQADIVVPVPLHRRRQAMRGYNQSEWIARGIAEAMNKPVAVNNLIRKLHTSTQTRKGRYERWQNVEGIFSVNFPEEFENRHILLVDDVVTTGSTLEACATELMKCRGTKVSITTLAFAEG